MSVSPFRAYEIYHALKLHFAGGKYRAPIYRFKTKVNLKSFEATNARYTFEKLSRKFQTEEDAIIFFTSQMMDNPNFFVTNYDEEIAADLVSYVESGDYRFRKEMKRLIETYGFSPSLYSIGQNHPKIVDAYLRREVSFVTMAALYAVLGGTHIVSVESKYPVVWNEIKKNIDCFNDLNLLDYKTLYRGLTKLLSDGV